jgi:tetratricopeptide (TPR) repeat protein
MKVDRYDLALDDFNKSLEINPRHANSLHNRGIILYKIGQTDKACEDWCQAQLLGSTISGIHMEKNCKVYPQACLFTKTR